MSLMRDRKPWEPPSFVRPFCAALAVLSTAVLAQAPDPGDSTKVLDLTTFATFSTLGFSGAIDLEHPRDGSGRVFVSTNEGKVFAFSSSGASLGVFVDLAAPGVLPDFNSGDSGSHNGLSWIAFHPDYGIAGAPGEGRFYTLYKSLIPGLRSPDYSGAAIPTRPGNTLYQHVLTEWTVDPSNPNRIDPSSRREVLRLEFSGPLNGGHSVGDMNFDPFARPGDPDYGNLYLPVGDMDNGAGVPDHQHAQDKDNPFGKMLRIDPLANGADPYSVPPGNPFADGGTLLDPDNNTEEIAAWGFRNPQSSSFALDANGNPRLVVFDIGADDYEEVDLVDVGDNHGWSRHDGPANGNLMTTLNLPAGSTLEFPAAVYDHVIPNVPGATPTSGNTAITGGYVVSDPNDPCFDRQVVFGDLARGAFFHADFDELVAADAAGVQTGMFVMNVSVDGSPPGAFRSLIGASRGDARFGVDESGRLFVVSRRIDTVFVTDLVVPSCGNAFFQSYGSGCAGSGGIVPVLAGGGCPNPGSDICLEVSSALGTTLGGLALGTGAGTVPVVPGCSVQIAPLVPGIFVVFTTGGIGSGNGSASIRATIPVSLPVPMDLYAQVFLLDSGGSRGLSASNPLQIHVDI